MNVLAYTFKNLDYILITPSGPWMHSAVTECGPVAGKLCSILFNMEETQALICEPLAVSYCWLCAVHDCMTDSADLVTHCTMHQCATQCY